MKEELEFNQKVEKVVILHSREKLYNQLAEIRETMSLDENNDVSTVKSKWLWFIPFIALVSLALLFFLNKNEDQSLIEERVQLAIHEFIDRDIDEYSEKAFVTERNAEDDFIITGLEKIKNGQTFSNQEISQEKANYLTLLQHIKLDQYSQAEKILTKEVGNISNSKREFLQAIIQLSKDKNKGKDLMSRIANEGNEFSDLAKNILSHE